MSWRLGLAPDQAGQLAECGKSSQRLAGPKGSWNSGWAARQPGCKWRAPLPALAAHPGRPVPAHRSISGRRSICLRGQPIGERADRICAPISGRHFRRLGRELRHDQLPATLAPVSYGQAAFVAASNRFAERPSGRSAPIQSLPNQLGKTKLEPAGGRRTTFHLAAARSAKRRPNRLRSPIPLSRQPPAQSSSEFLFLLDGQAAGRPD
mgnify:CR=1 FL=1